MLIALDYIYNIAIPSQQVRTRAHIALLVHTTSSDVMVPFLNAGIGTVAAQRRPHPPPHRLQKQDRIL